MADLVRLVMKRAYDERMASEKPRFLSTYFGQTPDEVTVSDTTEVEIDIQRENRKVAVDVVRGAPVGNANFVQRLTDKKFKVPLYNEYTPITPSVLLERIPGMNPYEPQDQAGALAYHAAKAQAGHAGFILNAVEKQGAEILESGTVTLKNTDSLDYKMKATHIVTPGTKWDGAGLPITDIQAICDVIFQDGKIMPTDLVMGTSAFNSFINNAEVIAYMNGRYIEPGRLAPGELREGARAWGRIAIGPYILTVYVYNQFHHDTAGAAVPYLTTDSCLVIAAPGRRDKAFGAVEILSESEEDYRRLGLPMVPGMERAEMRPYVIIDQLGQAYRAGVQSAPLLIPVAIDTHGVLINVDT